MKKRTTKPASNKPANAKGAQKPSQLRIIGGEWRSRKVPFVAVEGLRPTHDRVRETLFNWLQAQVAGAHCADLFSGSGALGLEALSRGAESMLFVEQAASVATQLKANLKTLNCVRGTVANGDVLQWLKTQKPQQLLDVVFLDPPFNKGLAQETCELLESQAHLSNNAWVYVEVEKGLQWTPPANWRCHREKTSGQVTFSLFQRTAP